MSSDDVLVQLRRYIDRIVAHREDAVTRICALSKEPEKHFLVPPETIYNFRLDSPAYVPLAMTLLKVDRTLDQVRHRLVPARTKEAVFWRNYISRVFDIAVSDGFVFGDEDDGDEVEDHPDTDKVNEVMAELAALVAERAKPAEDVDLKPAEDANPTEAAPDAAVTSDMDDFFAQFRKVAVEKEISLSPLHHIRLSVVDVLRQQSGWIQEALVAASGGEPPAYLEYVIQAVVTHHLAQRYPAFPMLAKAGSLALGGDARAPLRKQVLSQCRRHLPDLSDDDVLDKIGYASYDGGDCEHYWTLWPLSSRWALHLGLVESKTGLPVLGCILDLPRQRLVVADKGGGAQALALDDEGASVELPAAASTSTEVQEFVRGVAAIATSKEAKKQEETVQGWINAGHGFADFLAEDTALVLHTDSAPIGSWECAGTNKLHKL